MIEGRQPNKPIEDPLSRTPAQRMGLEEGDYAIITENLQWFDVGREVRLEFDDGTQAPSFSYTDEKGTRDRVHVALASVRPLSTKEEKEEETNDLVNHPPHYQGSIECIDAIEAALTEEEFRGYIKGNAIKYIYREAHKNGDEDLKKARWYITRLLED